MTTELFTSASICVRIAKIADPPGENGIISYQEEMTLTIPNRMEFVSITPQVVATVRKSGVQDSREARARQCDTHYNRQIVGRDVVVALTDGNLDFGPWK